MGGVDSWSTGGQIKLKNKFFEILDQNYPNEPGSCRSRLIFSFKVKLRRRGRLMVNGKSDQTKSLFLEILDWNNPK